MQANLSRVTNSNFENSNATALISSAAAALATAESWADSGDFIRAITSLKNSPTLVGTAVTLEASYQTLKSVYLPDLLPVTTSFNSARASDYKSPNATLYLNQATGQYSEATFLAAGRKYARADAVLRSVAATLLQHKKRPRTAT